MTAIAAAWLGSMSLLLFIMMGADKSRAKRGARRIRERTLFIIALLGGGIGGLLGMAVFRHKTRHTSFRVLFPLFTILNIGAAAALILLASKGGLP